MFENVDPWDAALWTVAAYVAVVTLVRLMASHRDKLVAQFRAQVGQERERQAQLEQQRKKQEAAAKKKAAGRGATA